MLYVNKEFAHGAAYDYSGVIFYGRSIDGVWIDRLEISDRFMDTIFDSITSCCWHYVNEEITWYERDGIIESAPSLISALFQGRSGWRDISQTSPVLVSSEDARKFVDIIDRLKDTDLSPYTNGTNMEDLLRCIRVIIDYISTRLADGVEIWIEYDS
jgi:hypothetical protein